MEPPSSYEPPPTSYKEEKPHQPSSSTTSSHPQEEDEHLRRDMAAMGAIFGLLTRDPGSGLLWKDDQVRILEEVL